MAPKVLTKPDISQAQKTFISAIETKVKQFLGTQLDGEFQMVNYPAGFNYGIT